MENTEALQRTLRNVGICIVLMLTVIAVGAIIIVGDALQNLSLIPVLTAIAILIVANAAVAVFFIRRS